MHIRKTIGPVIELVPKVIAEILEELKNKLAISQEDVLSLNLILEEAMTNAMQHGNKFDKSLKVTIALDVNGSTVTIRVKDEGQGFDYKNLPDVKEANRQLRDRGRGLSFIFKYADEVTFDNLGSEIRITKKLKLKKKPNKTK